MTTLEVLLLVFTAPAQFIPTLHKMGKRLPRWIDFLPAALLILTAVHLLVDGFHLYMAVVYGMVAVLFLQTVKRLVRPGSVAQGTRKQIRSAVVGSVLGLVFLLAGIVGGPMMASGAGENLSQKGWTTAFDRMHRVLVRRYSFSQWKGIDWQVLKNLFAPRVAAAEASGDQDAFILAIREYLFSIPDGHIKLDGPERALWLEAVGGGFGFSLIEMEGGAVIAHKVLAGGPAATAGMEWGAEFLSWDGQSSRDAIEAIPTLWWEVPPATQEGRRYIQQVLRTRAPIGSQVRLVFQNQGDEQTQEATLTAVDDDMEPLYDAMGWWDTISLQQRMGLQIEEKDIKQPPSYHILPQGIGYIQIFHVIPDEGDPDFAGIITQAVIDFIQEDVMGVIIDVRSNPGGHDNLVAEMMGNFVQEPLFYEYMVFNNWLTGLPFLDLAIPLRVEPRPPYYDGPVMVLVDQHTRSSGEGFPLLAQQLPGGAVVGIYGTHGSFGMCCGSIQMPTGIEISYPVGQSQNADRQVQLDGDASLQGGVVPDHLVPLTWENLSAMFREGEDIVLQYAVKVLEEGSR